MEYLLDSIVIILKNACWSRAYIFFEIFWLCTFYVVDFSLHSFKVVYMVFTCKFEKKIKKNYYMASKTCKLYANG